MTKKEILDALSNVKHSVKSDFLSMSASDMYARRAMDRDAVFQPLVVGSADTATRDQVFDSLGGMMLHIHKTWNDTKANTTDIDLFHDCIREYFNSLPTDLLHLYLLYVFLFNHASIAVSYDTLHTLLQEIALKNDVKKMRRLQSAYVTFAQSFVTQYGERYRCGAFVLHCCFLLYC